jgi:glutamine synthetase
VEHEPPVRRARELAADLAGQGVRTVRLTSVDNAGVTRVKSVPIDRLAMPPSGEGDGSTLSWFCAIRTT